MDLAPECDFSWEGAAAAVVLLAIPLAILITALTVFLYRRSVAKAMRHSAGDVAPAGVAPARGVAPAAALHIAVDRPAAGAPPAPMAAARAAMRETSLVYLAAGLAHSIVITGLYLSLNDIAFRPIRAFVVWLPFAWPIVLTMTLTAAPTRRLRLALIAGYFVVLLAVDYAADVFHLRTVESGFGELVLLWTINMGLPTLVIVLLSNRAWRSVGLIALFLGIVLSGGYQLGLQALGCLVLTTNSRLLLSSIDYLLLALIGLLFTLAWLGLERLVRRYQEKRYSDQMLVLDSWWLLLTMTETLFQLASSGPASFVYVSAYAAYRLVVAIGLRRATLRRAAARPRPLLMLRVFGFDIRTRRLIDLLGQYWRYVGPIDMIAGTDLATSLIEPHELIQFWRGRLRAGFVANERELASRLDKLDVGRDPDGRFRINEFFCHEDTWQATVRALVRRSDAVVMDLRGFGRSNRGCEFELGLLLDEVPLDRVVMLVDGSTRMDDLGPLLQAAWGRLGASSPNRDRAAPVLRLFHVEDSDRALTPLLSRLFASAAP